MSFKPTIAVVCFNKRTFNGFLDMVAKEDRPKFRYVNGIDSIRGMRFCQDIMLHDAYKIKDIEEITRILNSIIRKEYG